MAGALDRIRVIDFGQRLAVPGRPVSPPGGDAEEVLSIVGMADKLDELVEKRVIAPD